MRRQKTVTVDVHGWQGEGRNKTEAKRAAIEAIELDAKAHKSPELIQFRGTAVVLYWSGFNYCYSFVADPDGLRADLVGTSVCGDDRDDARRSAARHVLDITLEPDEIMSADDVPEFPYITDDDRRDLAHGAKWQRRYRQAKAEHPEWDHHTAHQIACQTV